MTDEPRERTFVGVHIPKCAGTTLLERALAALPRHEVFQNTSIIRNWLEGRPEFMELRDPRQLRLVWGHTIHEEMLKMVSAPVLLTGLREPFERLRSEVGYQARLRERQDREPLDREAFIRTQRNPMCWFLINRMPTLAGRAGPGTPFEKAKRLLEQFHFVYFTETFEESSRAIFEALGVSPPAVNANVSDDPRAEDDIPEEQLEHDVRLYAWAREHFAGRDARAAFDQTSPALAEFLAEPVRKGVLRRYLYASQYGEYSNWGRLDEIIEKKAMLAAELMREVATYASLRSGDAPSSAGRT